MTSLGVSQSIGVIDAPPIYTIPVPGGAVAVTSEAATDLDTAAAQIAALTTKTTELLTKLRAAGIVDS